MHMPERDVPSWLEVQRSGLRMLVGHFVGAGGSARPISKVNFSDGKISFSIPPQWEVGSDLSFEATLQGDSLVGTIVLPNGKSYNCSAVRAPSLKRETQPSWGKPIHLFNGKDLTGWHATGEKNQWKAEGGILKSEKSGSNIVTDATFNDFKLHVEFRYPKGSNSGVYLRGRYEVQIEDDNGSEPYRNVFSGIYGFISPAEITAKPPGEWNMYDITLVGRFVTVVANGKTVICSQEIPGITGGALNSREGEPGPIYLQGDHGPIEYRNIILTPTK
jgi:3-keto-disaccharide hydrolase